MTYEETITRSISQRLTDEISAATFYLEATRYIDDLEVIEELKEHAKDEFRHFQELMDFAGAHDLDVSYAFDPEVVNFKGETSKNYIEFIQGLEQKAIDDYKEMCAYAKEHKDPEAMELFKKIMQEEMEHFDDISPKLQQKRPLLGETSFKRLFDLSIYS